MLKFNLIVAVCENSGIGIKGELPWRLKSELRYFSNLTKRVLNADKKNAVIMGRRTFFSIPANVRPLPGRLNVVLSNTLEPSDLPDGVLLFPNLEAAMERLQHCDMQEKIENVWIIGGNGVYKEALVSARCHRLYITKIKSKFECDTFFPEIPNDFQEVRLDPEIPQGVQEENGVQFEYKILEKLPQN